MRDLIEMYEPRLRGESAPGFGSAPLPGINISLAVHRIGGVLDEPDVLRAVRAELQDESLEGSWMLLTPMIDSSVSGGMGLRCSLIRSRSKWCPGSKSYGRCNDLRLSFALMQGPNCSFVWCSKYQQDKRFDNMNAIRYAKMCI